MQHDYNISGKSKIIFTLLLILLNVVIRIPSVPHEKGFDSFYIHSLANSISYFGDARWVMNLTSFFGLYPYSYASAVPFTLSGLSQLTNIRMELIILLYCIILGLFSIFSSYLLSTIFFDEFLPRFLSSFIFSISAFTVGLTTWDITTRSQFLVFFPFLLYLLFRSINDQWKFLILLFPIFVLLLATHHYTYFAVVFSIIIIFASMIYKHSSIIKRNVAYVNNLYFLTLLVLIIIPFLLSGKVGFITSGSRYAWIIDMIMITVRNIGFIFPIAIGGIVYLSFKKYKKYEEWGILLCLFPTIIFSYNKIYGYMITSFFMILFGAIGFFNVLQNHKGKIKLVLGFIVVFMILSTTFSSFFAHWRLGMGGGYSDWYMKDQTYRTGVWIKENINENETAMFSGIEPKRMYASYGGKPTLYMDNTNNYINGLISFDINETYANSILSTNYYLDGPIVMKSGLDSLGYLSWISEFEVNNKRVGGFISRFNISYFFEDSYASNVLVRSLPQHKNILYNSGRMKIWDI